MSRRPNDLDPGGDPGARGPAPNGRPPAPPGGPRPGGPPPERPTGQRPGERPPRTSPSLRWVPWIVLALIAAAFLVSSLMSTSSSSADLTYSEFVSAVDAGNVKSIEFNKSTGEIKGVFNAPQGGKKEFTSSGPKDDLPAAELRALKAKDVDIKYVDTGSNLLGDILLWVLPLVLIVGLFVWISRRAAQGQMGAVMNIGRSAGEGLQHREAEDDVRRRRRATAPVKEEITEVVDFLQEPGQVQGDRRAHPEGRAARRPARHRQDAHRPRGRR